eukprot:6212889-Pleurochrysis_carterae.AAC.1
MEAATRGLDPNNNAPIRNNETDLSITSDHRGVQQGSNEASLGQKRARKELILLCACKTVPKEHVTPVVPPPTNFWGQPSKTTDNPTPLPVAQEEMELARLPTLQAEPGERRRSLGNQGRCYRRLIPRRSVGAGGRFPSASA